MNIILKIKNELQKGATADIAKKQKFFQAFPGGYGEGDIFAGIPVPHQRKVARANYKRCSLEEAEILLQDPVHEYRLTALFILIHKYEKAKTSKERRAIVDIYLDNLPSVNNWDLIDSSAHKILGPYLSDKDPSMLYKFARSDNLWKQRIAIITTFHFIRHNHYNTTLELAKILLPHTHDLIHKAVGWMLREIGKRDYNAEYQFLKEHYKEMPRTMLRYAIEKFEKPVKNQFLKGKI